MTSVPPTHPPAAPESEGDLAKALRDAIWAAFDSSERLERCTRQDATALGVAVERIVAERVRVVEGERDRLRRWKDEALPVIDGLQDLGDALGLPLGERITGPAAVEAARGLTARAESAEAAHAEAEQHIVQLTESRDRAKHAHEQLQAAVEALAAEWAEGPYGMVAFDIAAVSVRALLSGGCR